MLTKNIKTYHKKRFWAGLLLAQFLLFFMLSKINFAVGFFERFFEFQKRAHQILFSRLPFSAGDFFYILLAVAFLFISFRIMQKKKRNYYLCIFLALLNLLYFTYQISWGMLYFQKPLIEKLPEKNINTAELKILTIHYLEKCKQTRTLVKEDRNGVFTISDIQGIENEILKNQIQLPPLFNDKKGTQILAFKSSLFKSVMSYTGIFGYYNPFSAEAQYNSALPSTSLPFTLSHESAHQLGYAKEQEASFIAFLIGKDSQNSALKYSTEYFVLKSLLRALSEKDPAFVKMILSQYSPEMKRDRSAEQFFVKKHEGFLDLFFSFTNDLFLKSNREEGSITYSYFIDLLIRYQQITNS